MTTTFSAREDVLTTEYRQKASLLAAFWSSRSQSTSSAHRLSSEAIVASTDAPDAQDHAHSPADAEVSASASRLVAQHMLLHHPGYLPVHLLEDVEQREEKEDSATTTTGIPKQASGGVLADPSSMGVRVHVPSCAHCGGALQPGYMGTTVRLHSVHKSPSRTQRRRASRSKAKQMLMSNTRKKNRPAADSNLMEFCRARRQQQHQQQRQQQCGDEATIDRVLRDCRNYLVIKCGMCQSPCRIPGLPRQNTAGNGSTIQSASSPKNTLFTSTTAHSHSRAKQNKLRDVAASAAVQGDDGDFVALEPVAPQRKQMQTQTRGQPAPSTQTQTQHHPPPAKPKRKNMTLLDSSKKKKKKKSDQLLSFLSSLNE
jgi:hypothetical protein